MSSINFNPANLTNTGVGGINPASGESAAEVSTQTESPASFSEGRAGGHHHHFKHAAAQPPAQRRFPQKLPSANQTQIKKKTTEDDDALLNQIDQTEEVQSQESGGDRDATDQTENHRLLRRQQLGEEKDANRDGVAPAAGNDGQAGKVRAGGEIGLHTKSNDSKLRGDLHSIFSTNGTSKMDTLPSAREFGESFIKHFGQGDLQSKLNGFKTNLAAHSGHAAAAQMHTASLVGVVTTFQSVVSIAQNFRADLAKMGLQPKHEADVTLALLGLAELGTVSSEKVSAGFVDTDRIRDSGKSRGFLVSLHKAAGQLPLEKICPGERAAQTADVLLTGLRTLIIDADAKLKSPHRLDVSLEDRLRSGQATQLSHAAPAA